MEVCSLLPEPSNKVYARGIYIVLHLSRNAYLTEKHNYNPPKFMKTGTTIAGFHFKDGIIIGADTRATAGFVADKNCEKIHQIAPNIFCCGAGTAADTFFVKRLIASKLTLLRCSLHEDSRVITAATRFQSYLFKYHGYCQAALILGGWDRTGGHIFQISPEGAMFELPFATMGSGCLAAMSIIENEYHEDMSEDEAKVLMTKAIRGGIFNDLGSGSNVDLRIIKKGENEIFETIGYRNYDKPNNIDEYRTFDRPTRINIPQGATIVVSEEIENIE